MSYNFKSITKVNDGTALIDIVLSKTQRKTPTIIHKGYSIQRIRKFYMRKVKFCAENFHEKLTEILDGFPRLDDIHPFYADLMNVLYDRDHYKLALGQINKAKGIMDNIAKDYVRMLKYSDSQYRGKMLKRAALGRMCTLAKKLSPPLSYLEEVRKHLGRLPTIDPMTRTLLLTGFPNVGKSSFINHITNANVDVQAYPFTTQSLFVGHTYYKYAPWQVIDTPGVLDRPLEQRNLTEMQAITALAHLNACIVYILDISETCGYILEQQIGLFRSLKPLFENKPLLLVLNKTDLRQWEDVDQDRRAEIEKMAIDNGGVIVQMSNVSGEGVDDVKAKACDILLAHRLEQKGKKEGKLESIMNRVHVAIPKPRDNKSRPTSIPPTVRRKSSASKLASTLSDLNLESQDGTEDSFKKTIKQIQDEYGGAGVFTIPTQEHFILDDEEWKFDAVPEILNGKNVADFIDPEIMSKLAAFEAEEEILEAAYQTREIPEPLDPTMVREYRKVAGKKAVIRLQHHLKKNQSVYSKKRDADELEASMKTRGFGTEEMKSGVRIKKSIEESVLGKRSREEVPMDDDVQGDNRSKVRTKVKEMKLKRTQGIQKKSEFIPEQEADRMKRKILHKFGRVINKHEGIADTKPKRLNTGKMSSIGKRDWR